MRRAASGAALRVILLCAWIAWSQHLGSDGSMWWRPETPTGVSSEVCRALVKTVAGRPKVGMTKWYDVSPQQLERQFGHAATPDKGTWIACWPEAFIFGEPDS